MAGAIGVLRRVLGCRRAGVAALRALLLTLLCGTIGLIAWRRTAGFYRSVAAALLAMLCCSFIAAERPHLFTYFLLAAVIAILEYRRVDQPAATAAIDPKPVAQAIGPQPVALATGPQPVTPAIGPRPVAPAVLPPVLWLWALPPLFLLWANLHGAFFLGWIVLGVYCADALLARWRGAPHPDERRLFLCAALAVLVSGINPNGFHIVETLLAYRHSPLQTSITEWQRPKYWEISTFTVVLYASLGALLWARRRARVSDWMLYLLFAAAALMAVRNIILIGIIGPILLASYLPSPQWRRPHGVRRSGALPAERMLPTLAAYAAALCLLARIVTMPHPGLDSDDWRFSAGAADFLLAHRVTARLFHSYESGGYLMWRLWPQNQVFIDGRALSEATFADYKRMAFNADSSTGPSAEELLNRYGVGAIVMPMIDYSGKVYLLPAALSDPSQHEWKLVYADRQAVIYMRTPPPGVTPLPPAEALSAMEAQCNLMLNMSGDDCARGVAGLYAKIGDRQRAAQWMSVYQSRGGGANAQFEGMR